MPSGTTIADTVSEFHFGSLAQTLSFQPSWTAARTPPARYWWRANTFSRPSSRSRICSASFKPYSIGSAGVYGK